MLALVCLSSVIGLSAVMHIIQVSVFILAPFSNLSLRVSAKIAGWIWTYGNFLQRKLGALFTLSGDVKCNDSAMVISNHLCVADWAVINNFAIRQRMISHCKYFIKSSISWIPIFGLGMRLLGFPVLSRNWSSDKQSVKRALNHLTSCNLPFWLISFSEGTRLNTQKLKEAQDFSKEKNYPILENVLYPRKKGFIATVEALRLSKVRYLYDFTLAYLHIPSNTINTIFPTIMDLHSDLKNWKMHLHVDVFCISDLPEDHKSLGEWLESRWIEKDELINKWKQDPSLIY